MLDALWIYDSRTEIPPDVEDDAVLGAVTGELQRQQMVKIFHFAGGVGFKENPFLTFKGNWHSLLVFDHGLFKIERVGDRRYLQWRLASDIGFPALLAMILLIAVAVGVSTGDAGAAAETAGIFFAVLYGGNMLLVVRRVPALMRRLARGETA